MFENSPPPHRHDIHIVTKYKLKSLYMHTTYLNKQSDT